MRVRVFILLVSCTVFFWLGMFVQYRQHQCPPDRLPSIIDIQKRIGAKPDGKLGAETERLWNIAYGTQEAEKFFTESGAPDE